MPNPTDAAAPCRVALLEPHPLQREHLQHLIESSTTLRLVGSCETLEEFMKLVDSQKGATRVSLLLVAHGVLRTDPEAMATLTSQLRSNMKLVVLHMTASGAELTEMMRAGAFSALLKSSPKEEQLLLIEEAARGRRYVSVELAAMVAGDSSRPALPSAEERLMLLRAAGVSLPHLVQMFQSTPGEVNQALSATLQTYLAKVR